MCNALLAFNLQGERMFSFKRSLLPQNDGIVHNFLFLLWIIFIRKEIFSFWSSTEYSDLEETHQDHQVQHLSELFKVKKP